MHLKQTLPGKAKLARHLPDGCSLHTSVSGPSSTNGQAHQCPPSSPQGPCQPRFLAAWPKKIPQKLPAKDSRQTCNGHLESLSWACCAAHVLLIEHELPES